MDCRRAYETGDADLLLFRQIWRDFQQTFAQIRSVYGDQCLSSIASAGGAQDLPSIVGQ